MFNIPFLELIKPFWQIMKQLWYIWIIIASLIGVQLFFRWFEEWSDNRRIKKWFEKHKILEEWKTISGTEFEKVTAIIFNNLGYKTKVIGGSGDREIDIKGSKDGKRIFIQCKNMEKVKPHDIRAFSDTLRKQNLKEGEMGIFVTTGEFTKGDEREAKEASVQMKLINGIKLENLARS